MFEWKDPTLNITQDAYSQAVRTLQKAKKSNTTVENRVRKWLCRDVADVFFSNLHELDGDDKGKIYQLTGVAGACLALAFELAEKDAEVK